MRIAMLRKQSSLARWAIVLACLLGFGASAMAAELSALYADGQRQDFPVVVYEGVEHLSLKNLERLLLKVDEGARIERQYYSNELRITIRGKSVTISDEFMVVAGTVFRPQNSLRSVGGEMLVPVDTLQELNSALGLLNIERGIETPALTPTATPTPAATQPLLPDGTLPQVIIATPPPEDMGPLPDLDPATGDEPLQQPDTSIESPLTSLMGNAPLANFSKIGIVAFAADRKTYGENADVAGIVAERTAQRLRENLQKKGQFTVLFPEQPWSSHSLQETVDWANGQQCDALIAITVDSTPIEEEQGVRIMIAHEAADASARQVLTTGRGLPQAFNYIPYEQKSAQLAQFLHESLLDSPVLTVRNIEMAPLYLLRRVAMPAVEISLGSVTSGAERDRMTHGRFSDEVGSAAAKALVQMRDALQGGTQ